MLVRDMGELSEEIITTMLADIPLLQVSGTRHIGTGQDHVYRLDVLKVTKSPHKPGSREAVATR